MEGEGGVCSKRRLWRANVVDMSKICYTSVWHPQIPNKENWKKSFLKVIMKIIRELDSLINVHKVIFKIKKKN